MEEVAPDRAGDAPDTLLAHHLASAPVPHGASPLVERVRWLQARVGWDDRHERLTEHPLLSGLRDVLSDVGQTAIVGISPDPPSRQRKFDEKYGLGFPLLSDEDHAVAEAYGVWAEKSMYGRKYMGIKRSAFLVDEKGRIAEAWYGISPKDTAMRLVASLHERAR